MAKLLILGAGVMGSALTIPAVDNGNQVTLVGSPLDAEIMASIKRTRRHPKLNAALPEAVVALTLSELTSIHVQQADVVIIAVSSPGIDWVLSVVREKAVQPTSLAIVTKGLVGNLTAAPQTYAHLIRDVLGERSLAPESFIAIGGPCIAREIVFRMPTSVTYASDEPAALAYFAKAMSTPTYRVHASDDVVGVEACAALKNFFAIGVSSMLAAYEMPGTNAEVAAKNPLAAAFNQAVVEMELLCQWMQGSSRTAFGLAGLGDLQVTVGGGRNSRLGKLLGEGLSCSEALAGPLLGETVEGVDTGKVLEQSLSPALANGQLKETDLPLTLALVNAIKDDKPFAFDFALLGSDT